jgi:sortase (surface protein transpeptidase)
MSETIIYQVYSSEAQPGVECLSLPEAPVIATYRPTRGGVFASVSKSLFKLSISLAAIGILLLAVNYEPVVFAWAQNINISKSEAQNITATQEVPTRSNYQPPFDPRLPTNNRLIIPAIGVNTDIQEATYDNYESALESGVWRVSDFGDPNDNSMPTILAAHRYGYLAWTNLYRHLNSFYNLPKLQIGDTVEIDWRQHRYIYEIYAANQGTQITDYSADLILYTCVNLTGDERVFRYARLINI